MTQKILYFTAGPTPTSPEAAEIAALQVLAGKPYDVLVRNGAINAEFGEGRPEPADFLAGTIPATYLDEGDPIYPEFDPADPPQPGNLPDTMAVVFDGQVLNTSGTGDVATISIDPETKAVTLVLSEA